MCLSPCHIVGFRYFFGGKKQGDNQLSRLRLIDCKGGKEILGSLNATLTYADNVPLVIRKKESIHEM